VTAHIQVKYDKIVYSLLGCAETGNLSAGFQRTSPLRSKHDTSRPGLEDLENDMESATTRKAIWRNQEHDEPVTITHELGEEAGKKYYAIAESVAGIPEDELVFLDLE